MTDHGVMQVFEYENSGLKLGYFKSINESLTRIAVYIALMALYYLGGNKVKAVSTLSLISSFRFGICISYQQDS